MFNIFGLAFNHSGVKRLEKHTNVLSCSEIYSYLHLCLIFCGKNANTVQLNDTQDFSIVETRLYQNNLTWEVLSLILNLSLTQNFF